MCRDNQANCKEKSCPPTKHHPLTNYPPPTWPSTGWDSVVWLLPNFFSQSATRLWPGRMAWRPNSIPGDWTPREDVSCFGGVAGRWICAYYLASFGGSVFGSKSGSFSQFGLGAQSRVASCNRNGWKLFPASGKCLLLAACHQLLLAPALWLALCYVALLLSVCLLPVSFR